MEQPPKGMPVEQLPLDLGNHEEQMATSTPDAVPEPGEVTLESLSDDELNTLYKEQVGVDPKIRSFDRATVIAGLSDPKVERDRLSALDMAEDQELRRKGRQNF